MDQNPLPRASLQIRDRTGEELRAVPELPQTAVAVEAQYPAHPAGAMIVIDVLGIRPAADRAHAPLLGKQLVDLGLPDPVAVSQVVFTPSAVKPLLQRLATRVVARLAVAGVSRGVGPIPREIALWLRRVAVWAVAVPRWQLLSRS